MDKYILAHTELEGHGYRLPSDTHVVLRVAYVVDGEDNTGYIETRMPLPVGVVVMGVQVRAEVGNVSDG